LSGTQPPPSTRDQTRVMAQLRTIIGFTAMLLFAVCVIVWIAMVLVPTMTGQPTSANVGTLSFWTIVNLTLWRLGAGRGWGFAAAPARRVEPSED